jgi:hypothetical protein
MTEKTARNLDFGRKLLIVLAATVAIAIPVVFGLIHIKSLSVNSDNLDSPYQISFVKGLLVGDA